MYLTNKGLHLRSTHCGIHWKQAAPVTYVTYDALIHAALREKLSTDEMEIPKIGKRVFV
jgi:hypothetical protein